MKERERERESDREEEVEKAFFLSTASIHRVLTVRDGRNSSSSSSSSSTRQRERERERERGNEKENSNDNSAHVDTIPQYNSGAVDVEHGIQSLQSGRNHQSKSPFVPRLNECRVSVSFGFFLWFSFSVFCCIDYWWILRNSCSRYFYCLGFLEEEEE